MTTQMTQLDLIQIIHDYSIEEFGGRFFYLPQDPSPCDRKARAWLEMLLARKLIRGGPWRIHLQDVHPRSRALNPSLFGGKITVFQVYRVDRDILHKALVA